MHRRVVLLVPGLLVGLALVTLVARAQDRPARDPALTRFVGEWSGEGQVEGQDALAYAGFSWALADRFLSLSFSRTGGGGAYEAQAYLRPTDGRLAGTWLDSAGEVTTFEARREGSTLTLDWAHDVFGPERIVFTLRDERQLELTTFARKGAAWEPTGRLTLTRGS